MSRLKIALSLLAFWVAAFIAAAITKRAVFEFVLPVAALTLLLYLMFWTYCFIYEGEDSEQPKENVVSGCGRNCGNCPVDCKPCDPPREDHLGE